MSRLRMTLARVSARARVRARVKARAVPLADDLGWA